MPLSRSLIAAAIALCSAVPAQADIFTMTGSTTGGPTFHRPIEDFSSLSAVGSSVNYRSFTFSVGTGGSYSFLTTADFDSFALLYGPAFSPAAPTSNGLVANDDLVSTTTSGFAWTLDTGVQYTYVVTAFANGEAGAFSTTIGGPGTIAPIPEPAVAAMLIAGLVGLGAVRRRGFVAKGGTR